MEVLMGVEIVMSIVMDTAVIAVDTMAEVVAEEAKCCER